MDRHTMTPLPPPPVDFLDRPQAGHERFHPSLPNILDVQVEIIRHVAHEARIDYQSAAQQLTHLALNKLDSEPF